MAEYILCDIFKHSSFCIALVTAIILFKRVERAGIASAIGGGIFFRWIAPEEHPGDALPLTLLLRATPVFSLLLLLVNDHYLKGRGILPTFISGKLSDFAGLVFFPLLLLALYNLFGTLLFRYRKNIGILVSPSPTFFQLLLSCLITGVFFTMVQLSSSFANFYAQTSAFLMFWSHQGVSVTQDPSDIWALLSLFAALYIGARALKKVPPYRVRVLRFQLQHISNPALRLKFARKKLRDLKLLGANLEGLEALAKALVQKKGDAEIDQIVKRFR